MSGDYVVGEKRNQSILFPDTLDEYITEENPVRFIDAFVDSLDLEKLGFRHATLDGGAGRPPYNPSDLLKLYVYGYLNQIRSSRKLEKACLSNVEVMWLMKKLTPDFKTVADFRKDNIDCIKPVFKEFVYLCRSLDLFGAELIAIDGSKFKAVNSTKRNLNGKTLPEAEAR
jgi:transposase